MHLANDTISLDFEAEFNPKQVYSSSLLIMTVPMMIGIIFLSVFIRRRFYQRRQLPRGDGRRWWGKKSSLHTRAEAHAKVHYAFQTNEPLTPSHAKDAEYFNSTDNRVGNTLAPCSEDFADDVIQWQNTMYTSDSVETTTDRSSVAPSSPNNHSIDADSDRAKYQTVLQRLNAMLTFQGWMSSPSKQLQKLLPTDRTSSPHASNPEMMMENRTKGMMFEDDIETSRVLREMGSTTGRSTSPVWFSWLPWRTQPPPPQTASNASFRTENLYSSTFVTGIHPRDQNSVEYYPRPARLNLPNDTTSNTPTVSKPQLVLVDEPDTVDHVLIYTPQKRLHVSTMLSTDGELEEIAVVPPGRDSEHQLRQRPQQRHSVQTDAGPYLTINFDAEPTSTASSTKTKTARWYLGGFHGHHSTEHDSSRMAKRDQLTDEESPIHFLPMTAGRALSTTTITNAYALQPGADLFGAESRQRSLSYTLRI